MKLTEREALTREISNLDKIDFKVTMKLSDKRSYRVTEESRAVGIVVAEIDIAFSGFPGIYAVSGASSVESTLGGGPTIDSMLSLHIDSNLSVRMTSPTNDSYYMLMGPAPVSNLTRFEPLGFGLERPVFVPPSVRANEKLDVGDLVAISKGRSVPGYFLVQRNATHFTANQQGYIGNRTNNGWCLYTSGSQIGWLHTVMTEADGTPGIMYDSSKDLFVGKFLYVAYITNRLVQTNFSNTHADENGITTGNIPVGATIEFNPDSQVAVYLAVNGTPITTATPRKIF